MIDLTEPQRQSPFAIVMLGVRIVRSLGIVQLIVAVAVIVRWAADGRLFVAIVVVGPKELPRLMRTFGHYTGKLRAMASDFQRQFEDAVRDSEIDEVRKAMQDFHAQASDVNLRGTVDKPLMMPTPLSWR